MTRIHTVEDPSTGMVLERVDKVMKGVRYTGNLVVNDKSNFASFSYVYSGDVWILFGCPRAASGAESCKIRGKSALVAQHVLYPSFEEAFNRFRKGELQAEWMEHRKKLRKIRSMK